MLRTCGMSLRAASAHFARDASGVSHSIQPDRRKRARVRVQWPLQFGGGSGKAIEAVTHDLSSHGFYCLTSSPMVPGEVRVCTLSLPANHPDQLNLVIPVHCRVRVVRVEALAERGPFGVGCRIDDYWVHQAPVDGAVPPSL